MTIDGTLVTLDSRPALRFERRYRQPIERVWRAITDPDEMAAWFPSRVIGPRTAGSELVFDDADHIRAADDRGEAHRDAVGPPLTGTVIVHEPPKVFSFSWGGEVLRFELHPDGDATLLVFTQILSHRSVAGRNGAGWHSCLAALDAQLGVAPPDDGDDVYEEFAVALGIGAGQAGPDGSRAWELGHHVAPERVRDAVGDPDEVQEWGAGARTDDIVHWDIRSAGDGSVMRITVAGAGTDPELAAIWHALLVQLDMYLAAGIMLPVDPGSFVESYERPAAQ